MKKFLLLFFMLVSCANNSNLQNSENLKEDKFESKDSTIVWQDNSNSVYKQVSLPFWFYHNSSCGDYSISINHFSYDREKMLRQALEDVSVQIAKNIACFVIDKKAETKNKINENIYNDKAEFSVQIADSFALQKVKDNNLYLIAEQKIGAYYLTFYSFDENQELINDSANKILKEIPNKDIEIKDSIIYAYASYEAEDLKLAYEKAVNLTRKKIANYLEKEIAFNKYIVEEKKFAKNYSKINLAFSEETSKYLKNFVVEQINILKSKKKYKVLLKIKLSI